MLPKPYFKDDYSALYLADSFDLMPQFPAEYFHVIFADPPYFLSNGGFSCSGGKKFPSTKAIGIKFLRSRKSTNLTDVGSD